LAFWGAGTLTFSSLKDDVREIRNDIDGLGDADTNIRSTVADTESRVLQEIADGIDALRAENQQSASDLRGEMQRINNIVAKLEGRLDVMVRPVTVGAGEFPFGTTVNAEYWQTVFSKDVPKDAQFVILPANEAGAEALKTLSPTP